MKRCFIRLIPPLLILLLLTNCDSGEPDDQQPETPIFSDVEKIEISQEENPARKEHRLFYVLPEQVEFAVIEIFEGPVVVDDEQKIISVENLAAGSRTGFEEQGFGRGSIVIENLLKVKEDKSDFDPAVFYSASVTGVREYDWIVFGYDSGINLTHASPAHTVTIDWDS